jgi:hypothetical protein
VAAVQTALTGSRAFRTLHAKSNMRSVQTKRSAKPTVFLSHASANRRELVALKRFLDERAGGMIEFFLSSDDDSITPGTVWPTEVRAALDRMTLMLIFASPEAIKSSWTYFEAGYGLHKLGATTIYCLPGMDKASLPSPFNLLQNRNLHSAREIGLLIGQINSNLSGRITDSVKKEDFDRIFRRPVLGRVETGPKLDELVETIVVSTVGPANSLQIFSDACAKLGFPVTKAPYTSGEVCSTGIRLKVDHPAEEELHRELSITDAMREVGSAEVIEYTDGWAFARPRIGEEGVTRTIAEIEAQNTAVRKQNEEIRRKNAVAQADPRECAFTLIPLNLAPPTAIVDTWLSALARPPILKIAIHVKNEIICERQLEVIGAKIHGSQLSLLANGSLLWRDQALLTLEPHDYRPHQLALNPANGALLPLAGFEIEDLVGTLFELKILSMPNRVGTRRRR